MVQETFKAVYGYELEIEMIGKPYSFIFDFVENQLKEKALESKIEISQFYMIGDNPQTDIAGANNKGWTSILVKTGIFDPEAPTSTDGNDSTHQADYVVKDFNEAINLVYSLESGLPDPAIRVETKAYKTNKNKLHD